MAVLLVWAAVMLTFGVSAGNAMVRHGAVGETGSILPLDTAPNSVDDMYSTCKGEMLAKAPEYLKKETEGEANKKFSANWGWEMMKAEDDDSGPLSKEQHAAIRVYTSALSNLYEDLNDAVRSQGPQYKTSFRFHAFHFYLTTAIQTLKDPSKDKECPTVYRRVDKSFQPVAVNAEIRLGAFSSSSLGGYPSATPFGDKSCFKIVTCMGAEITKYSSAPSEKEVLIPPYEAFKVMEVKKKSQQADLPCEVEYTLQSTKTPVSHKDCALFK